MALDPSIITAGLQSLQPLTPQERYGNMLKLRALQQQIQGQDALEQERRDTLQTRQRAERDQQTLDAGLGQGYHKNAAGVWEPDPDKIVPFLQQAAPHLIPGVLAGINAQAKAVAENQKLAADAADAVSKANKARADQLAADLIPVKENGYNPGWLDLVLSTHEKNYPMDAPLVAQIRQQAAAGQVKGAVDGVIGRSESRTKIQTEQQTAATGVAAQAETGRHNQATETTAGQQLARENAAQAEAARHNRATEGLEQQKVTQAAGDKTELTPAGIDAAAMMYAKSGQLPPLGMGDKTTRKAIINRAAVMVPGLDVASAKADYDANKKSLGNITGTLDTLSAFESTAGKNLDQFLSLAAKIPDTGVPWVNTPVRLLTANMVGSENQAAANAARDVALREIARVTNDPKLSGVLSDSARHEVSSLSPQNATFAQIKAVAKVLKQDMANVHGSLSDQRDGIARRIKLATDTPAPPSNGSTQKTITVAQVQAVAQKNKTTYAQEKARAESEGFVVR